MDYEKLLNHLKKRKNYFEAIDFQLNAKDLNDAIVAIESLLKELKEKEEKQENILEEKEGE